VVSVCADAGIEIVSVAHNTKTTLAILFMMVFPYSMDPTALACTPDGIVGRR
jgi:hypothetical protein